MNQKTYVGFALMVLLGVLAPYAGAYPIFLMKALCFALFACAFNLLLGFTGLLSFGHAAFFGTAGYAAAYSIKAWGFAPEFGILFLCTLPSTVQSSIAFTAIAKASPKLTPRLLLSRQA